ncbi:GNAT family N-acetyltransferase [Dactylosporangium sp. CA-092794]|uniref:GNAT family N-acetyltransferase n=1 Tax=Dactylosporangium sp. CA-092794 TaxID=3239929 RepID=UPI003D8F6A96
MRVALRPWREGDAEAEVEATFAPGDTARTIEDDETGAALGVIKCMPRRPGIGELAYWVSPQWRRRRVATTALELFSAELLQERFQRLYVETALANEASQRAAISAGFVREGVSRGGAPAADGSRQDTAVWARLAGDPPGPSPRVLPDLPDGRLTDGVVALRPIREDDGLVTYHMRNLPEVRGRSVVSTPPDPAVVARQCAESMAKWLAGQRAEMTIRRADDDGYLGEIALYYFEPALREAMIGYSLTPEARGQGYAARAARLVTGWGFEIGMNRMTAGTATDNIASQRVLEAAGYTREVVQPQRLPGPDGTRIDNVAFAKLRPAAT